MMLHIKEANTQKEGSIKKMSQNEVATEADKNR